MSHLPLSLMDRLNKTESFVSIYDNLTIIISIFKEDYIFCMTTNLPYDPPMNTHNDYYLTIFFSNLFVSGVMLVVRYMLGEEKPVFAF